MHQPVPKPGDRPKRDSLARRDKARAKGPVLPDSKNVPPLMVNPTALQPLTPEKRERIARGETDVV